jgi:hypothetical protein
MRLSPLERDFTGMKVAFARMHARLGVISRRLDRVEHRLDLVYKSTLNKGAPTGIPVSARNSMLKKTWRD